MWDDALPDDQPSPYRQAAETGMEVFFKALSWVMCSGGNRPLAFECAVFAIGKGHMIPAKSEVDLAKRHNVKKQTVSKLVTDFQKSVGIEPMPGQRKQEAIESFREARLRQLRRGYPRMLQ